MVHLLVYGSSIFLAGVTAQLEALAEVQISQRQTLDDLGNLNAYDAVLIDLNDPASADVLKLLRVRPDLHLICLNAATSALTILSGKVYFTPTLAEIIDQLMGTRVDDAQRVG